MPGYRMQSGGTARTPLPQVRRLHLSALKKKVASLQSGLGTQTANQAKFIPPIINKSPSPLRTLGWLGTIGILKE